MKRKMLVALLFFFEVTILLFSIASASTTNIINGTLYGYDTRGTTLYGTVYMTATTYWGGPKDSNAYTLAYARYHSLDIFLEVDVYDPESKSSSTGREVTTPKSVSFGYPMGGKSQFTVRYLSYVWTRYFTWGAP